jgi:hypothetical protein
MVVDARGPDEKVQDKDSVVMLDILISGAQVGDPLLRGDEFSRASWVQGGLWRGTDVDYRAGRARPSASSGGSHLYSFRDGEVTGRVQAREGPRAFLWCVA